MEAKVLSEAKVYVGTYAKYNNGSLSGAWLDLSDYSDKEEFYEACRELHKDEEDAEYMFQDWENVPEGLIGESWISENFFPLLSVAAPAASADGDELSRSDHACRTRRVPSLYARIGGQVYGLLN